MMKRCKKCGEKFPATSEFFYEHRRRGRVELRTRCKPCILKQCHEYGKNNADTVREYNLRRAKTEHHREIIRKAQERYRAKPEYRLKDRKQYRRTVSTPEGREKIRVKVRRRRARINGSTRHHTVADIRTALEVQNNLCFYCRADISASYTVDHLIPLIRGGSDGPENIVMACASCNFRKADRTPEEFKSGITHRRALWRSGLPGLHF
jgi:5-methylcytosine-specific restriction endonuclease McrA